MSAQERPPSQSGDNGDPSRVDESLGSDTVLGSDAVASSDAVAQRELERQREQLERIAEELDREQTRLQERQERVSSLSVEAIRQQEREARREWLLFWSSRVKSLSYTSIGVAVALVLAALAGLSNSIGGDIGLSFRAVTLATVGFSILAFMTLVAAASFPLILRARRTIREQAKAAQKEADDAAEALSAELPLFELVKLNRKQMLAYDAIARGQATLAFRNSQIAMALGLLILLVGAATAIATSDTTSKVTTASLTAIGGALAGYISKTFLNAYFRAVRQMNFYFAQPLVTSYMLGSERLISRMSKEKRDDAFSAVIGQVTSELLRPPIGDEDSESSLAARPFGRRQPGKTGRKGDDGKGHESEPS